MSKLKELIDRLCPDGVEYKSLKSIAIIKNGKDYKHCATGDIPVYGSGGIMTYIDQSTYNQPTVLLPRKGSIGKIYYVDTPFWNVDTVYYTDINLDIIIPKFLYYFLTTVDLEKMNCGKGAVPSLTQEILYRIKIPIPPLEVQEDIVRILDKFDSYAAELQAELQARKEQYEYYRNLLLSFNPSACGCGTDGKQEMKDITTWGGHSYKINWKTMENIFEMRNGYTPSKNNPDFWEGGTIPWFRMEDIRDFGRILSDSYQHITPKAIKGKGLFEKNSFILATTATIGEHAMLIADSLANQQFTNLKVRKSLIDKLVPKFIYYYMFIVDEFCKNNTNVSGFASVDMGKLKKMPFPIPPIELQNKIVSILDRFETLVNDLTQGLPAEIAAVKEQYEYYRNKLLTFKQIA